MRESICYCVILRPNVFCLEDESPSQLCQNNVPAQYHTGTGFGGLVIYDPDCSLVVTVEQDSFPTETFAPQFQCHHNWVQLQPCSRWLILLDEILSPASLSPLPLEANPLSQFLIARSISIEINVFCSGLDNLTEGCC